MFYSMKIILFQAPSYRLTTVNTKSSCGSSSRRPYNVDKDYIKARGVRDLSAIRGHGADSSKPGFYGVKINRGGGAYLGSCVAG